jgi:hypothetical protein
MGHCCKEMGIMMEPVFTCLIYIETDDAIFMNYVTCITVLFLRG